MSSTKKEFNAEDYAYEKLKSAILTGEYKPGDRLYENDLSEKFDVSRTPIRKAMQKLESEMILESSGCKTGMQIYHAKKEDIIELTDIRLSLEIQALGKAMQFADKERFFPMLGSIERMRAACERNDMTAIEREDWNYHMCLYKAAESRWLERMGMQVTDCLMIYNQLFLADDNFWVEAVNEHMMLYNLIIRNDVFSAKELLTYHITFNKWNQQGIMKEILGV